MYRRPAERTLASGTPGEPITLTTMAMPGVTVTIPDTTTIVASAGWDGRINPPSIGTSTGTPPASFTVGDTVIEVGSPTAVLLFDRPVGSAPATVAAILLWGLGVTGRS